MVGPGHDTTGLVHVLMPTKRQGIEAESVARQIWGVSHGNPFMIVESVQALVDAAAESAEGGLALTPRVREVVASRLGHLTEHGRRLIAVAAVFGRAFDFAVLQRAAGLGEIEAAEGVEDLIRRRLLHASAHDLDVTHEWVRAVAYGALQPPLRQVLHAAVARALEEQYSANLVPHYPALARHYREGEVWDEAVIYLHATGRTAAARAGHREAVSRFEAALEVLPHLPESRVTLERGIDLRLDLRYSLTGLGEFSPLIAHLREAEMLARRLDDEGRLGWVHVDMSHYTRMTRRPADGYPLAESARAIAEKLGDVDLGIEGDYELGMARLFAGDHSRAQELLRRTFRTGSQRLERTRGRTVTALSALSYLGWSLAECGRFEDAAIHSREALRLAEELDSPINSVVAHSQLSNVHEIKGEFDLAVPILERGLAIARGRELTLLTPGVMGSLACAYAMAGRVDESLTMLDEMLTALEPAGIRASQSHVVVKLGEACLVADRLEQAGILAARALALTCDSGLRGWEASALRLLGEVASRRGALHLEEAETQYRAALARSQDLGLRPLEARCHLGLGTLSGLRPEEAQKHLAVSITTFRQLGMAFWLQRATAASEGSR